MDFAVKVMDQGFIRKENKTAFVLTERKVMSRLSHPNIVKFYCSFRVRLESALAACRHRTTRHPCVPSSHIWSGCGSTVPGPPQLVPGHGAVPRWRSLWAHQVHGAQQLRELKRKLALTIIG
jgi:serine/threonine protein kinase